MPTGYPLIDPNTVFQRPWEWSEISSNKALMLCKFSPVVMVSQPGAFRFAQLLQSSNPLLSFNFYPLAAPRFYTQIGCDASHAADSVVPKTMSLSDEGAAFIGGWEGLAGYDKAKDLYFPYDDKDPKGLPLGDKKPIGFPTIGYGHLIVSGEDYSKGITKAQVDKLFAADHVSVVKSVNKSITVGVSQQQFDAIVSLAFNAGPHAKTPPIKHLNAGKAVVEGDFTKHYITSKKVVMKGLQKRRKAEWNIFSTGVYDSSH